MEAWSNTGYHITKANHHLKEKSLQKCKKMDKNSKIVKFRSNSNFLSTNYIHVQGESYVPVRQTEAVARLLMRLLLIFLLSIKIECFLQLGKTYFCSFFSTKASKMVSDIILPLSYLSTLFSGCPMQLGGCMKASSLENGLFNTP